MKCEDGTFCGDVLVNPGQSGHGIVVDDASAALPRRSEQPTEDAAIQSVTVGES